MLGRDVFSRMVYGSQTVMAIAPLATLFAYMVGITLGLPAGYFGGWLDTTLSFLANLVLAFPVILLFYLLVTPEIRQTAIPGTMAAVLFVFPVAFLLVFFWSRFRERPEVLWYYLAPILIVGGFGYLGLTGIWDPTGLIAMEPNTLNIFLAVVFITSPTVFRIVRGLTLDIKTRDYVAAAQTRGERPWYIMMWEILPNARGPLIVDACLRIGYTTILLGTLGFFGLGVSPEVAGLGLDDQRGAQAPAGLRPPCPAAGARDHEPGAGPEPARRRAARAVAEGLRAVCSRVHIMAKRLILLNISRQF